MTIQSYHGDVMMLVSGQERVTGQLAAPHRVAMLRAAVTVGGLGEPHPPPHPLPGYTGCLAQLSLDSNHVNLMQTSKGIIVPNVTNPLGVTKCTSCFLSSTTLIPHSTFTIYLKLIARY